MKSLARSVAKVAAKSALTAGATALDSATGTPFASMIAKTISSKYLSGNGDFRVPHGPSENNFETVTANDLIDGVPDVNTSKYRFGPDSMPFTAKIEIGGLTAGAANTFTLKTLKLDITDSMFDEVGIDFSQFSYYQLTGVVASFVSTCSDANGPNGEIGFAFTSDNGLSDPTDMRSFRQLQSSLTMMPCQSALIGAECVPSAFPRNLYKVRDSTSDTDDDCVPLRLFVATNVASTFASSTIGTLSLIVKGVVDMRRPRRMLSGYYHTTRTTAVAATPLGTASGGLVAYGACKSFSISSSTTLTLTGARKGQMYHVHLIWTGTAAASTLDTSDFTFTNCELSKFRFAGTSSPTHSYIDTPWTAVSADTYSYLMCVRITGDWDTTPTIALDTNNTLPTSTTYLECLVYPVRANSVLDAES